VIRGDAGDTRTRNLYKLTCTRNFCMSVIATCNNLQRDFFGTSFLHSRANFLHEIEHVLFDVLVQEICIKNLINWTNKIEIRSINNKSKGKSSGRSFQRFVQVSCTSVTGISRYVSAFQTAGFCSVDTIWDTLFNTHILNLLWYFKLRPVSLLRRKIQQQISKCCEVVCTYR